MKKNTLKLVPLLILVATAIFLLLKVVLTNTVLMREHLVGLGLLAIVIGIHFSSLETGFQATGILLFLGILSVVRFTPTIYTFSMGIIKFDLFCLPVGIIYCIVHRNNLPQWILWLFNGKNA